MPNLGYLAARVDLIERGYLITGGVRAHPQTPVVIEYMRTRDDPRHEFEIRAIVYELKAGQLSNRLCFAHLVKEKKACSDGS